MVISASLFKSTRYPLAFIPHNAIIEELSDFYLSRHYHMNIFVSFKHQKKRCQLGAPWVYFES